MIKRALLSVYDKTGVVDLARYLHSKGVALVSSGGTYKAIVDAGMSATKVSEVTSFPEILDGRVKTLHPAIHGGILARDDQLDELRSQGLEAFDLVVVNLYPFEKVAAAGAGLDEALENVDIGGPAMLRAAAKNFPRVTVVCDPNDYTNLKNEMDANNGATSYQFRMRLAARAFSITRSYDKAISTYLHQQLDSPAPPAPGQAVFFPRLLELGLSRQSPLRYGENPHQQAALYAEAGYPYSSLAAAHILSGKELSFNNIWDLEAALQMILDFRESSFAAVIKHTNPCGAAVSDTLAGAYRRALESDPLSAFGSIIALRPASGGVDTDTARLLDETHFIECILAPDYEPEALEILKKKKQRRIVAIGDLKAPINEVELRIISGGALAQTRDTAEVSGHDLKIVTKARPTDKQIKDLLFGFKLVKHVKSNAVLICRDGATVGIGAGQTSRVDSSLIAVRKAGERAKGAVAASDAFFPMPDGLEVLADAGVVAVIQPGGSKGDPEVIAAADRYGVAMVFTGIRHFKH